jgi:S1-C subfamily serine protease
MEAATDCARPRGRAPLGPIVCCIVLLIAVGVCLYRLYAENTGNPEDSVEVQRQRAAVAQLLEEKAFLESLREKTPCDVRRGLLGGAGVAPLSPGRHGHSGETSVPPSAPTPVPEASPPHPAQSEAPDGVVERLEDATVFVLGHSAAITAMGSGFFIAPDLVLTNRHVIERTPDRLIVINKKLGGTTPAHVVAASTAPDRDYALLRVDMPVGVRVGPLAFSTTARRAGKISAWGYPHAVSRNDPKYQALVTGKAEAVPEPSYADGVISAVLDRNPQIIVHTAPLSPGNSGGPLADEKGNVLGINTMISLDEDSYRQTSLALHASDILRFLKENAIEVSPAE